MKLSGGKSLTHAGKDPPPMHLSLSLSLMIRLYLRARSYNNDSACAASCRVKGRYAASLSPPTVLRRQLIDRYARARGFISREKEKLTFPVKDVREKEHAREREREWHAAAAASSCAGRR